MSTRCFQSRTSLSSRSRRRWLGTLLVLLISAAAPVQTRAGIAAAPTQRLSVPGGLTAYSIGDPTDEEQLYVELINRARADPTAEGERLRASTDPEVFKNYRLLSVDLARMAAQFAQLTPAAPLSIHPQLTAAARVHSEDMFAHGFQAHEGSDGATLGSRAQAQGYAWSALGENVFSYAVNVEEGHAAFEVDWGGTASTGGMQDPPGHRLSIHNPTFHEIGVGVVHGTTGQFGPQFVTQDFGSRQGITPFITGVVYYDLNGNGAYDLGEGLGGVTVLANGSSFYALSARSGGYSIPLPQGGEDVVTFSVAGAEDVQASVSVNADNVKLDHRLSYVPPALTGPDEPLSGQANLYTFTPVAGASSYEWKRNRLAAAVVEGAENGLDNVTVTSSPGYSVIDATVAAAGQNSFHLGQPQPEDQILTINQHFLAGPTASLSFASRLGWAAAGQVARVQISVDQGKSWQEVWSQAGTGDAGDSQFLTRNIPLGSYANQDLMVRFIYAYTGGDLYPQTDSGVGFYIDNISFSDAVELTDETVAPVNDGTSFAFTPGDADSYLLTVRALVSGRAFPWAPAKRVVAQVGPGPIASVHLDSVQRLADGRLQIDFAVVNVGSGTYRLKAASDPAGPWANEPAAVIENVRAGSFRALLPAAVGLKRFYRVASE